MNPDLPGIHAAANLDSALKDAEVILLLVRHSAFVDLKPADIASRTQGRLIIDTVNGWNAEEWTQAGFEIKQLTAKN
jgi:predicted dinucleotide-binding enzyme